MENYYDKKIDFLYNKYIELFKNSIKDNKTNSLNTIYYYALKIKKEYPNLENKISNICYIFSEVNNSEEKLDQLLNIYPKIKEDLNGL